MGMTWYRTCADGALLQFEKCESEDDKMAAEKCFSYPSGVRAVQGCSAGECAETLILFRNELAELVLGSFLGYDP